MTGGLGADELDGRGEFDSLIGDGLYRTGRPGKDVMRGGPGIDYLGDFNDRGRDSLLGEGGTDYLDAVDSSVDQLIDGGSGEDRCRLDPGDPTPVSCEGTGGKQSG